MFRFYLKKLLRCPATFAGAVVLCLSMIVSVAPIKQAAPLYLFQYAFEMGVTHFFPPLACALPVCFVRSAFRKGSAWQFPLLHSSPLRYSAGGLFAAYVSGAVTALLGYVLFFLFIAAAAPGSLTFSVYIRDDMHPFYSRLSGLELYLLKGFIFAANGGMFAAIAYAVSGFSSNQYLCAASPFVLYMSVSYVSQHLAQLDQKFFYLDPGQVALIGICNWHKDGGLLYMGIYIGTVVLLCLILFRLLLQRRLSNG